MKITRRQLRKAINESISHEPASASNADSNSDKLIIMNLSRLHMMTNKLNDIYNSHRSWDTAGEEQKLMDEIRSVREELYAVGLRADEVNAIVGMDYDEFDAYMNARK